MRPDALAEKLKALSAEPRVRIVMLLRKKRFCAGAISRRLGATPSATSQHLRVLRTAGLVKAARCGNRIHYSLDREALAEVSLLMQDLLTPDLDEESNETSVPCGQKRKERSDHVL